MENFEKLAKDLAAQAGQIMLNNFKLGMDSEWKEDDTPLTVSDSTINQLVIDEVKAHFPDHGVLGEEDSFGTEREYLWVVDPVDGTMPFSQGIPTSVFSLALVHKGETIVGVVQDPFADRQYLALNGGSAYVNGAKMQVNTQDELGPKTFVNIAGHSKVKGFDAIAMLASLDKKKVRVSKNFSAIYWALPVATGQHAGAFIMLEYPWDGAAVSRIVAEAGGKVTDLRGHERSWNQPGEGIILSNGVIHDQLLEIAAGAKG
jgi:myo-inositol-1(or 4)-monophosphatase